MRTHAALSAPLQGLPARPAARRFKEQWNNLLAAPGLAVASSTGVPNQPAAGAGVDAPYMGGRSISNSIIAYLFTACQGVK
jgi:hypothetical protein